MRIKVISLWHPHAWAMQHEHKKYETRNGGFINLPGVRKYRGPIAIHSAKQKFDPLDYEPQFGRQLKQDGLRPEGLVYGAILAVADWTEIHRTEDVRGNLSQKELMYGNYEDERFAIEITNLRRLATPMLVRGHQGLFYWDVPPDLADELRLSKCDCVTCPNAGMPWRVTVPRVPGKERQECGSSVCIFRFCSDCYNARKKVFTPEAIFTYADQEVAHV